VSAPSDVKRSVRAFYDELGWRKRDAATYEDAARFEDLRPTSSEYIRDCYRRVKAHLAPQGHRLLDVASGPIQREEFLEYSEGYRSRVCVDLSMVALQHARERLGGRGLFVVGDITRLPFRDGAFDGVVSVHTIYHVPAEEQASAFRELHRSLATGKTAVVVYSWGKHSPLMFLFEAVPAKLLSLLRSLGRRSAPPGELNLYFQPQSQSWLKREVGSAMNVDVRIWRALSPAFMKRFVPGNALGRWWLRKIFAIEERMPHLLGRIGCYPMILIRK